MTPGRPEPTTALTTTILANLDADARQSLSAATRTAYESDWRAFGRGVDVLPSSPGSVAAFAAQRRSDGRPAEPWQPEPPIATSVGAGSNPAR